MLDLEEIDDLLDLAPVFELLAPRAAGKFRIPPISADGAAALPELLRLLDAEHIGLRSISLSEPTLDDVFLAKTGRSLRDAGPAATEEVTP